MWSPTVHLDQVHGALTKLERKSGYEIRVRTEVYLIKSHVSRTQRRYLGKNKLQSFLAYSSSTRGCFCVFNKLNYSSLNLPSLSLNLSTTSCSKDFSALILHYMKNHFVQKPFHISDDPHCPSINLFQFYRTDKFCHLTIHFFEICHRRVEQHKSQTSIFLDIRVVYIWIGFPLSACLLTLQRTVTDFDARAKRLCIGSCHTNLCPSDTGRLPYPGVSKARSAFGLNVPCSWFLGCWIKVLCGHYYRPTLWL